VTNFIVSDLHSLNDKKLFNIYKSCQNHLKHLKTFHLMSVFCCLFFPAFQFRSAELICSFPLTSPKATVAAAS